MNDVDPVPGIPTARFETCAIVRCRYHAKESRYRVKVFEESALIIVECLECHPPSEILRAKIDTKRKI